MNYSPGLASPLPLAPARNGYKPTKHSNTPGWAQFLILLDLDFLGIARIFCLLGFIPTSFFGRHFANEVLRSTSKQAGNACENWAISAKGGDRGRLDRERWLENECRRPRGQAHRCLPSMRVLGSDKTPGKRQTTLHQGSYKKESVLCTRALCGLL